MKLKFDTTGEAFVGITTLIMYSDQKEAANKINSIIKNFFSQPLMIFNIIDNGFFWETNNKILRTYFKDIKSHKMTSFTEKEMKSIIEAGKEVLKPELRETAFLLAAELAIAAGITKSEKYILDYIKKGFELDNDVAEMIMGIVKIKYYNPTSFQNIKQTGLPVKFSTVAEAIVAIELAVILADEEVSMKQINNIFWNVPLLNVFTNKSPEFYHETLSKILNMFKKDLNDPVSFNNEEIDELILASKQVLNFQLRETAFYIANELAFITGLNKREDDILYRLSQGMNIDKKTAEKISKVISIKFRM